VGEGRKIYDNIRKSIHFLLSTNLSEILVMFTATAAGLGQPLCKRSPDGCRLMRRVGGAAEATRGERICARI
jgi:hypothetical protein